MNYLVTRVYTSMLPPPRPVVAHLVHFAEQPDGTPEFWTLRLYRDNFDSFSAEDRMVIFNWVSDVVKSLRVIDPKVYVEVYEEAPRER